MAASRHVRIVVGDELPEMCADPARLELALMNLVSNGIKYSDPSKVDSFVEVTSGQNAPEGSCVLCVRDNGLGIAEADRVAIFERFFRAHAHLDAQLGVTGSGLGLAITADCIQAMGGTIQCESTVGVGSRFLITLPLKPAPARNRSSFPAEHGDAS